MKHVIRLFTILISAIVLTALTPAYAASSFGRTSVGTIPSGGLREDFKRGSKFVMPEAGVLQQICAYLDTGGTQGYGQSLRYALYRDQNGVPGQLIIATNGPPLLPSSPPGPSWVCQPIQGKWLQEAGTYWLMIHTGGSGGVIRYYYDGAANWYGNADEWDDGASYIFGPGGTGDGTMSIRADYVPVRSAGATAVGTTVSSPMAASMKRGSSFTLTEKAAVWKLNAYIDAQGGAGGSQPLWIALYDDLNGEPGALVTKTQVDPGPAGGAGHWVSGQVAGNGSEQLLLMPGKYWIALYTGSPAGVLRYYMTGTGNWRGNANLDAEPSSFFGPANTGNGTITANISYTAENVLHHTMGRTTPGTVASGPLSANYIRGSETPADHGYDGIGFKEAWLTGLWAYVDGNGGTAGSQKLRLGLYYGTNPDHYYADRVVMSDEVTIPAGKAAGWVRFPVPYTPLTDDSIYGHFHVMLLSGGTQGVARYYLSNDFNNWAGAAYPYSATGPGTLNFEDPYYYPGGLPVSTGTGTVSVYAEYLNTAESDIRTSP